MMLLLIAMVMSAVLVKAYEQGKYQTKARWQEAQRRAEERSARREREKEARTAAWSAWFDRKVSSGPRHPLWWVYAAGWTTGGAIAALGAGTVGVYSGAVAGGRSGYTLGVAAAKHGRKWREAFRTWRKANREKGEPVELGICGRCEGWIAASELVSSTEYGLVCPDCVPASTPESQSGDPGEKSEPRSASSTVYGRNYAGGSPRSRCRCGAVAAPNRSLCWSCLWREAHYWSRTADQAARRRRAKTDGDQHQEGPIRVTAERVDPEQKEEPQQKEIANTMARELTHANHSEVASTGEGLNDTLRTLNALAHLLTKAHEEMTGLSEQLTANSLDVETLNQISELNDLLDTAAPMSRNLYRHVENRHDPIADAVAAAGGSGNVATKSWYDDH